VFGHALPGEDGVFVRDALPDLHWKDIKAH
jgi:hypothetical protein